VIRKRIISYSTENATQKICEDQGIPCLHKIERLSEGHMFSYPHRLILKKEKAVKEKNLQPPSILLQKLLNYLRALYLQVLSACETPVSVYLLIRQIFILFSL